MQPERIELPPFFRAAWGSFAVLLVAFAVKIVLDQPRIDAPTVLVVAIVLLLAGLCFRISLCRVEVVATGLHVHNPLRSRSIAWDEFVRIEERVWFRAQPDAFVVRRDGRPIMIFAMSVRSWGADPFHQRRRELDAAIERARSGIEGA